MRSCPPEALTGSSGSVLRWTRMLLGHGVDNPLLRGSRGFRPVRGCRNHMNDLVAAAFELVENFGQREDGSQVNVVQQQDALAARLDTADGASRNLAIVDAGRRWRRATTQNPLRSHAPPDPQTFCEWGGFGCGWRWCGPRRKRAAPSTDRRAPLPDHEEG